LGVLNNLVDAKGLLNVLFAAESDLIEMAQDALIAMKYDALSNEEQDEKEQELLGYISRIQDIREHILKEVQNIQGGAEYPRRCSMSANGIDLGILNNRVSADELFEIMMEAQKMAVDARSNMKCYQLDDYDEFCKKRRGNLVYIRKVQDICGHIIFALDGKHDA